MGRRGQEGTHPRPGEKHRRRRNGGGAARGAVHLLPSLEKTTMAGRKGLSHHATIIESAGLMRREGTGATTTTKPQGGGCRWSAVEGRRGPHKFLRSAARTWWCAHEATTRKSSVYMTLRFVLREHRIFDGKFLCHVRTYNNNLRKIRRTKSKKKKNRLIEDSKLSGQSFNDANELLLGLINKN